MNCLSCIGKIHVIFFNYHQMNEPCHYYFSDGSNFIFHTNETRRNKELLNHFGEKRRETSQTSQLII